MQRGHRFPSDDFFCWKFRVWYNLRDCVFRHVYRTTVDCAECEQGAANARLLGRPPSPPRWVRLLSCEGEPLRRTQRPAEGRRR